MTGNMLKTIFAGLAGGLAFNCAMFVTFRLLGFGWQGSGLLLNPKIQSQKLINVWTTIEPLPLIVSKPHQIMLLLTILCVGHAFVYRWISPAWPSGLVPRALRFAGLIFFMTFTFWELFTPFNLFGEPLELIALELAFWWVIALSEAVAIVSISECCK